MGCDIHIWAEYTPDWSHAPAGSTALSTAATTWKCVVGALPDDRSYHAFALLAGVRNRSDLTPIAEPRGVPPDASPEYLEAVEQYGEDGHSHSWLTLAELDAWDYSQPVTHNGIITLAQYLTFRRTGTSAPDGWCNGVGGAGIAVLSTETADAIREVLGERRDDPLAWYTEANALGPRPHIDSIHIQWQWTLPTSEYSGMVGKIREELRKLAAQHCAGDATHVRAVFYFDN